MLTNAHVARKKAAEVELWDGRRLKARVTSRDERRDLALLRIDRTRAMRRLSRAIPSAVRPGELALAIGSPLGFAGALSTRRGALGGPIAGHGQARVDSRGRCSSLREIRAARWRMRAAR